MGLVLGVSLLVMNFLGLPVMSGLAENNAQNILAVLLGSSLSMGFISYVSMHLPHNLRNPEYARNIVRKYFTSAKEGKKYESKPINPDHPFPTWIQMSDKSSVYNLYHR